jgi:PRTRC genetic system protein C
VKHHENQLSRTGVRISRNTLADPNPNFSIEEVRSFYATQFPELTNAAISGPETVGDRLRYSFERAIGSKG